MDNVESLEKRARSTGEAGDPVSARDQYTALLPVYERVLGREHPDTLEVRVNLARWTGEAGDPATARDQLRALLPVMERVLGGEHLDTLKARVSLAHVTGAAGDPATARDQLRALLPVMERVLDREHPVTLSARHQLTLMTGLTEDKAGARDQLTSLVPMYERRLGAEHPQTVFARYELALETAATGDVAGAWNQLQALLPVMERVFGSKHDATVSARDFLALISGAGQERKTRESGDPRERGTALARFASASGLQYGDDPRGKIAALTSADFQLPGRRCSYSNVLSGRWRDLPVSEADFLITTDMMNVPHHVHGPYGGATYMTHNMKVSFFSVVVADLPVALPNLVIRKKKPLTRLGDRLRLRHDIHFGSAEFNQTFQAMTADTTIAAKLIDDSMIEWLLSTHALFTFNLRGRNLLVWCDRLPVNYVAVLLDTAKDFTDHIPRQILAQYGRG